MESSEFAGNLPPVFPSGGSSHLKHLPCEALAPMKGCHAHPFQEVVDRGHGYGTSPSFPRILFNLPSSLGFTSVLQFVR